MSPFIIHEYPKWAETAVRVSRIASYAFACLTGVAALLITPSAITPELYIIIGSMALFGMICFVASIFKLYVIEWVSLFFLTAGITSYVAAVWVAAVTNPKYIASASIFMVLVLLLLIRLVDLTVFWLRNVRATKLRQELPDAD